MGISSYPRYRGNDRLAGSGSYIAINYQSAGDTDVKITCDKDGLITSTVDASGTTTNVYYPSTWLKTTTVSAGTSKTLTYQYNGVGLVSTLTIPGGSSFSYSYNTRNLLASVTNPDSVQVTFTYDDGGRRTRVTRPGSYIEYVYNARDWITAVRNRTTGGTVRYDALYYYNDGDLWDHTGNPLKRVENFGGSDFTTTLRYDNVYRETEETKRDSGDVVQYTHLYAYDEVGNRLVRNDGGPPPWLGYSYDANNKLTSTRPVGGGPPGPITANFYYDGAGNMTSVTGTEFGSKTLTYDDASRLSSIAYGAVTDTYTYNWQGLRTRAYLNGTWYRYLYNGERVLQELTNAGGVNATYTTENDSYYGTLLHLKRATGESRFPLYDEIGSARGLVDASATVTDTYDMDTFGRPIATTGSTPNPYRYGAAWGYITDPSGFLQLGARYYWPEVGRFVSQDPARDERNWYAYVANSPTVGVDADGMYRRRRDKCEQWIRAARALEKEIRDHIDYMEGAARGGPVASGPNGLGPRPCAGGRPWDHAKEVRQKQEHMRELLRRINKDCDRKQKDYFGGEIGKFREAAECPVPENPPIPLVPLAPLGGIPVIPPIPWPVFPPPPILVPVPI
jgi:RHS repeat-associated protein